MAAAAPRRTRVPGVAIAALLLLVVGVLSIAPALSTYLDQRRTIADTTAAIAQQEADLASLRAQQARWDDPAYVRAQAGSRLFYVLPGTTAYRVIRSTAGADDAVAPATSARPSDARWTDLLVGSLVTAGTTTRPLADLEPAG